MDSGDYTYAWTIYGTAALIFSCLCWIVLRKIPVRELGWLLQSWVLALLFTPWYVEPDQEIMSPALMVFAMDLLTIDAETAIRALIPLVMAMLFGTVMTLLMSFIYRLARRRKLRKAVAQN